ncbi:ligand-binding sensor domain-containing protein [Segetibacter koreensis]|uniref:ligand-binding sensor domain-containing protein n=1 Tax=Segetibacter koreensis TaxID=398037 RepID=UPI000372E5CD|nr:two-component regulator propeller domain-containing protein [Segetibacter koreensis]
MTKIIICILSVFFQIPAFTQQVKQYSFKHFSVSNGLASNRVTSINQDKDGYIWLATTNGLQRYDGHSFLTFTTQKNNPSTIPSNDINTLYSDKKGNLWLLTDNNTVGIFDTKKFVYNNVRLPKDTVNYFLPQHLVELPTGELLLIKNNRAVLWYVEDKNEFVNADYILPHPTRWKPNEITWDARIKRYWMSCDSGLVQYDPATKHLNYQGHNIDADPVIKAFANQRSPVNVRVDAKGNVFFYYWYLHQPAPYLMRYNRELEQAERYLLSNELQIGYHEITGFLLQNNGRLWVYGMPFFAEWTDGKRPFISLANEYKNEQSINFDYPFHAIEDRENNIWIATDNGVFLFNPDAQVFNTYNLVRPGEKMLESPVQAVAETGDGRIFVGCWGQGLFCFDTAFNPLSLPVSFKSRYKDMLIWDMAFHSRSKKLWITQQDGVLDVYDPNADRTVRLAPKIFRGSTIRQIDEDTSGNLWFGTQNGQLIKWDYKRSGNDPSKGYEVIYQTAQILKIHYDYAGYIWLGTLGKGLIKIDTRTHKVVRTFTTNSQPGERIFMDAPGDMTYYNDSTLLVSARCLNIINTKTNKVSFITSEDGLPSNTTESLQRDRNGIVWIGMSNGICRLNLQKKVISYYDRRDGIAYDKFSMAGVEQLSDKRMIFFTDHNFLVFDPAKIAQGSDPPRPYITSFKLAGNPLSIDSLLNTGKVILKYNNTSIGINFSALSYLYQRKLHYYYQLQGLDKDWIHSDHPTEIVYNYLSPGNYVFRVKSENADGIANGAIASIPIIVGTPVWNRWWFYGLIALLIVLILYLVDKERMNKRESLQQIRSQIGRNLADEITTTLNNINVLSEIAKIKADKNIEQSKEYIQQISAKSRYMTEAMDDIMWSINPENDSMKKTVIRMKELTEGTSSVYEKNIELIVGEKVETLELDMKVRHELFFFYKEAITFLVHNVSCQQIFVNIKQMKPKFIIEIICECLQANDLKMAFERLVQKRVEALPATIDVLADTKSFSAVLYIDLK